MSSHMRHRFTLSPPITASSLMITINDWSIQPCMGLLMLGCNFKNGMCMILITFYRRFCISAMHIIIVVLHTKIHSYSHITTLGR